MTVERRVQTTHSPGLVFDSLWAGKCNGIGRWMPDSYGLEIHNDNTHYFMCECMESNSAWEI